MPAERRRSCASKRSEPSAPVTWMAGSPRALHTRARQARGGVAQLARLLACAVARQLRGHLRVPVVPRTITNVAADSGAMECALRAHYSPPLQLNFCVRLHQS